MINVLLTSVGRRGYMVKYFKEALGDRGFVFASNNVLTHAMKIADEYMISPDIYDEKYIDVLLFYCIEKKIRFLISLFDIDLLVLSKNKKRFKEFGIDVLVSDVNVIDICNDKWKTYLFLKENNILVPNTFIELNEVCIALNEKKLKFPLILKPRWGMGSIGLYKVDSIKELEILYAKLKKDIFNTYLKYESAEDVDKCVLIQEVIVGTEYGLDVINDLDGNYITTIPKIKISMRAGETDIAEICADNELINLGMNISVLMKHVLNLDVDCFVSDFGIYVLEMNSRFGGQYPFSYLAGVDLPLQIVNWYDNQTTNLELFKYKDKEIYCKEIVPCVF